MILHHTGTLQEQIVALRTAYDLMVVRMDRDIESHTRNHEREHAAEQQAADLALQALNARLAGMNEFRAQISATESKYSTKVEADAAESKLYAQLNALADRLRIVEVAIVDMNGKLLNKDFSESVDERFRSLERIIYMASGALTVIMFLLNFLKH